MFRKLTLTICLVTGCVWCLLLAARADSSQPARTSTSFESVASVHALMYGQKTFFKQLNAAVKDTSFPERSATVGKAAEVLAELANVNSTKNDKTDYRSWAKSLRDTALRLTREAQKKQAADETKMKRLLEDMHETCTACHDAYQ